MPRRVTRLACVAIPGCDPVDPFGDQHRHGQQLVVRDCLVHGEEGEQTLRGRVVAVAGRAQRHTARAVDRGAVGSVDGVRDPCDQQRRAGAAWARRLVAQGDVDAAQDATAIPGMLFSSPSSAEVTLTGNPSIASGVSRFW